MAAHGTRPRHTIPWPDTSSRNVYEVLEAIETGNRVLLREELGDLLLQVLFHARLAQELPPDQAFGIDEIAGDLADKLIRRHPHVFARRPAAEHIESAATLDDVWEAQKIVEKGRTSALDGVPIAQPALALAAKLISRVGRVGLDVAVPATSSGAEMAIGAQLFATVGEAVALGVDPEGALRRVVVAYRHSIREAEASRES